MASIRPLASGPLSADEQAVLDLLKNTGPGCQRLTAATGLDSARLEQALAQLTRRGILSPKPASPPAGPEDNDRVLDRERTGRPRDALSTRGTGWVREAWRRADRQAASVSRALRDQDGGLVILPGGRRRCRDSSFVIASLLARTSRTPAVLVGGGPLTGWRRTTLRERLPDATSAVVDWCHPAPAEPRDLTLLNVDSLGRACSTLASYQPRTIAILAGLAQWPRRDTKALECLIGSVPDPLLVVEEWADPQVIALAVARTAGVTVEEAHRTVKRWLEQRDPWRRPTRRLRPRLPWQRDPSLGVLALCTLHPQAPN